MAENAAAPPGSATMRRPRHRRACAFAIASSETSTVCRAYFWTIGNTRSPTRRGASESAARPPASASTGCPASSAFVSVGDRDEHGVDIGRLLFEFEAERSLAQDGFVLVERRYRHGAGLLRPRLAGR